MRFGKYPAVVLAFLAPASLEAQNYANQLELQNCGAYIVKQIEVQVRQGESWKRHQCWGACYSPLADELLTGQSVCFNLTDTGKNDGRYRFKVKIKDGNKKASDDTLFFDGAGQRRVFRMKGTTRNNNRPKSRAYRDRRGPNECKKDGKLLPNGTNCGGISLSDSDDMIRVASNARTPRGQSR